MGIFFLIFGLIYEMFSHGVYSNYMMYAFVIPLIFGLIVYLIIYKSNSNRYLSELGMSIYNTFILTLTLGSVIKGFLEIYGTTNNLVFIYSKISLVLIMMSIIVNIIYNLKKGNEIVKETKKKRENTIKEMKVGVNMKERIILLVIGGLVGALLTSGAFLIFSQKDQEHNLGPRSEIVEKKTAKFKGENTTKARKSDGGSDVKTPRKKSSENSEKSDSTSTDKKSSHKPSIDAKENN